MPLTHDQERFVAAVRFSNDALGIVMRAFEGVDQSHYADRSFREWLVAIDATNRVASHRWYQIMVEGLLEHSPWLASGVLGVEGLLEIEEHTKAHGTGEYAIELMVALTEDCQDLSQRAESVARWLLMDHFNGIQPLTAHAEFVLKRFLEPRRPICDEDIELVLHIAEATKGLPNTPGAQSYIALLLRQRIQGAEEGAGRARRMVFDWIESRAELCEAELVTAKLLAEMGWRFNGGVHQAWIEAPPERSPGPVAAL